MTRSSTPWRRALALFLAGQPVLWMSDVALAQTLQMQGLAAQQADEQRVLQSQRVPGVPGAAAPTPLGGLSPPAPSGAAPAPFSSTPGETEARRAERPAATPVLRYSRPSARV